MKHTVMYLSYSTSIVAPLQVRGLKQEVYNVFKIDYTVAPLQVRGLKLVFLWKKISPLVVAPLQVRGLKHAAVATMHKAVGRTFTGAWIETIKTMLSSIHFLVAPLQVRGLKLLLVRYNIHVI